MTQDLIARVREEPASQELDRLVARKLGWFRYTRELGCTMKRGGWISPDDFIGTHSDGSPILDSMHGTDIYRDPPLYTKSIDAADSMIKRVMKDHHRWSLSVSYEHGVRDRPFQPDHYCRVQISAPSLEFTGSALGQHVEARARVIAALAALEPQP